MKFFPSIILSGPPLPVLTSAFQDKLDELFNDRFLASLLIFEYDMVSKG